MSVKPPLKDTVTAPLAYEECKLALMENGLLVLAGPKMLTHPQEIDHRRLHCTPVIFQNRGMKPQYKFDEETIKVLTDISDKSGVEPEDVLSEAIGLIEMVFAEIEAGNDIYVVTSDGKALNTIEIGLRPKLRLVK